MDPRVGAAPIYLFGDFALDAARLTLSHAGQPVATTHRVLATLLFMVENSGRTLSKGEMLRALWPDRTVEEANLSQAVFGLRKMLTRYGEPGLITTVPGTGYRFVGKVQIESAETSLTHPTIKADGLGRHSKLGLPIAGRRWLAAIAGVMVVALSGVFIWRQQALSPRLTGERTGIFLADPQDYTKEADLDHVVTQVLRADLDQSPMFQVASETEVARTLGLMEQSQNSPLTLSNALAVCARNNGGAVIAPSIAKLGQRYVLTLAASDCLDGRTLVDHRVEADDKEALVRLLSTTTSRMRRELGEMRSSIVRYDVPLAPERTSSFDALRAYSEAEVLMRQGRRLEAIPLYQHATELDPDFAMAYFGLSKAYYEFFQTKEDAAAITQAYRRIGLVSERNALLIREHYISTVTHDLDAARHNMELLTRLYSKDVNAWLDLAEVCYRLADYPAAAAAAEQGLKLDARNSGAYTTLARALNHLQQTARAERLDAQALKEVPETDQIRQQRIAWRYMQNDPAGGRALVASAMGTPFEREALLEASNFAFADGRVKEATSLVQRADALGRIKDLDPDRTRAAESYLTVGLEAAAREALARVPTPLWTGQDDYFAARLFPPEKARALLQRDLLERPHDTLLHGEYALEALAALQLRAGHPLQAAQTLQGVGRFMFRGLDAPYLRATALLTAGDGEAATAAFRAILAQTGFSWNPQFALSHLGLARALRLQGQLEESRAEYLRFFAAWRNADPDLAFLKQGKAEYALLAPKVALKPRHPAA